MSIATPSRPTTISADQALRIAGLDAERAYGDLSSYRIVIALTPTGWQVDYELTDLQTAGGGPHYVIDSRTGAIVSKRYEQ